VNRRESSDILLGVLSENGGWMLVGTGTEKGVRTNRENRRQTKESPQPGPRRGRVWTRRRGSVEGNAETGLGVRPWGGKMIAISSRYVRGMED